MILAMTLAQALQRLPAFGLFSQTSEIDAYNRGYADGLIYASLNVQISSSIVPVELQSFYAFGVNDRREGLPQRTKDISNREVSILPAVAGAVAGVLGFILILKASKRK